MAKTRVYELARELGVENKDVLRELRMFGLTNKTHSSTLDDDIVRRIKEYFEEVKAAEEPEPEKEPAKKKPTDAAMKEKPKKAAPVSDGADAVTEEPPEEQKGAAETEVAAEAAEPVQAEKTVKLQKTSKKAPAKKKVEPSEVLRISVDEPAGTGTLLKKKLPKSDRKAQKKELIIEETPEKLPEEIQEEKVPDRFKKEVKTDGLKKLKGKTFEPLRKVETRKWQDFRPVGRRGRHRPAGPKTKTKKSTSPAAQQTTSTAAPRRKDVKLQEGTTVKEFAELLGIKLNEIIKKFMELGMMPTINEPVDLDAAQLVAEAYGAKIEVATLETEEDLLKEHEEEDPAALESRPPVVTVMGHVDHGKTSLLDAIRDANVIAAEAGGITQHIGAYSINAGGRDITFLDTPGHEAFTAMRARGAQVTDLVVLVVAADDGVMPQTVEAIDHSKAAGVPILVAVNKIDKPDANPDKVKGELGEHGLVPEEWGGETIFCEVSAKQGIGIDNLLEMILLQADVLELKANANRPARGVVVEAKLDRGRGAVATVLVQRGTLRPGDIGLAGSYFGRVRALVDDKGRRIDHAGPSVPVEVLGLSGVPAAGDTFAVVEDERTARQITSLRADKARREEQGKIRKLTLDDLYAKIKEGEVKDLNVVVKADVHGSVEAVRDALVKITHEEVKVTVVHASAGGINESDVMLASASNAIIIGFSVRPEAKARELAEREGVDIRLYNVIYNAVDDVKKALEGMLAPTLNEKILGRAEVRQTFQVSRIGTIAGCYVLDGTISRASTGARIIRDNLVVYEGKISSLKRFKDDAKEVASGYECGITIENFNDLKVGDIIENYIVEEIAATFE